MTLEELQEMRYGYCVDSYQLKLSYWGSSNNNNNDKDLY